MIYKNYQIELNEYAISSVPTVKYKFSDTNDCDLPDGHGSSVEDCVEQIDEILLEDELK